MQPIRAFLEADKNKDTQALNSLLINEGMGYKIDLLTEEENTLINSIIIKIQDDLQSNNSFINSQLLILNDTSSDLKYIEGFIKRKSFPIPHAWCLLNDKVIDITPFNNKHNIVTDNNYQYFGIIIPKLQVINHNKSTHDKPSVIHNNKNGLIEISEWYNKQSKRLAFKK